jgi:hypothetical protein
MASVRERTIPNEFKYIYEYCLILINCRWSLVSVEVGSYPTGRRWNSLYSGDQTTATTSIYKISNFT